jgi:hypothetical protein
MIIQKGTGDRRDVENDQREGPKAQQILRLGDEGEKRGGGLRKRTTEWLKIMREGPFSQEALPFRSEGKRKRTS